MSSAMKRRRRNAGISNSRVNIGRERMAKRDFDEDQQGDGVDDIEAFATGLRRIKRALVSISIAPSAGVVFAATISHPG